MDFDVMNESSSVGSVAATHSLLLKQQNTAEEAASRKSDRWRNLWPSRRTIEIVSGVVLLLALVFWIVSISRMRMIGVDQSWFPYPAMGLDFEVGTYLPTQVWLKGENPYRQQYHGVDLVYPPFVLRTFAWTGLFNLQSAYVVFLALLAGCVAGVSLYAARWRRHHVDHAMGPLTAIAVMLFSTPVLFAMERGNYDLLVLPCLAIGAALLARRKQSFDVYAGIILAFAAWLKVYPALIGLVLLSNRRWHAFASFALTGAFVLIMDLPWILDWARLNAKFSSQMINLAALTPDEDINYWWHSLPTSWANLLAHVPQPIRLLRSVPGGVAAAVILLSPLVWTLWRFSRSSNGDKLVFPLLLWVTALASFFPPVANDYSLAFLPLAALVVWTAQDRWPLQLCMALMCLWWQPIALPIDGRVLFLFKLAGLIAVGVLLVTRLAEYDGKKASLNEV